jgi:hypothetical protein
LQQYAVLLPRRFNNGERVPKTLLLKTYSELLERFGAYSVEQAPVRGFWTYEGTTYHDVLQRVVIVDSDDEAAEAFFREYKEVLKERFQQLEIWITVQPIRVI